MSKPLILGNARVYTMDDARSVKTAIALADGRVAAVGDPAELQAAHPHATFVDLDGRTVLPGFVDAHHHVSVSALYNDQVDIGPDSVADIPSLQAALSAAADQIPDGRWVVATNWDEHLLAERRPPSLAELDDALPRHPLFAMHYTCHRALANSEALRRAGIDSSTPDPPGGLIGRDGKRPNGLLVERGMSAVEALARSSLIAGDLEGLLARMAAHYEALLTLGITAVADTTVPLDLVAVYREAARRGEVPIQTVICPVSNRGYLEEPWDVIDSALSATGEEDVDPLIIGPVKLVFDGAPHCSMCMSWWSTAGVALRTAIMAVRHGSLDPLRATLSTAPRIGWKLRTGIAIYQAHDARRVVEALVERGFGVATHAIGNAAIDVALTAYEAAGARVHDAGRARLEHASFLDDELIRRIADAGAAVVAQPDFIRLEAYGDSPEIPGLRYFPLRSLLDAGVLLAGSSDYPVAGWDPLDGVRSAVRRLSSRGEVRAPSESITAMEALRLYTRDAAEVCGLLASCGTIEAGKRGDLVVLDGDIGDLDSLSVRQTWVAGRKVYESQD